MWCQGDEARPRAVKMAGDELAILLAAGKCAGVAIHAQDRGGNVRTLLLDDQTPCLLALLRSVRRYLPDASDRGDVRHFVAVGGTYRVAWNAAAWSPVSASGVRCETILPSSSPSFTAASMDRQIVVEVQLDFAVVDGRLVVNSCHPRCRACLSAGAVAGYVKPERNH